MSYSNYGSSLADYLEDDYQDDMAYDVPPPMTRTASSSTASTDHTPPSDLLLQNIELQRQLFDKMFVFLSSTQLPQQQQQPLPLLYQTINQANTDLLFIRKGVREHQDVWARVERKLREVIELEKRTRAILRTIERERSELETMIREAREVVESVDKVEKSMSACCSLALFGDRY